MVKKNKSFYVHFEEDATCKGLRSSHEVLPTCLLLPDIPFYNV